MAQAAAEEAPATAEPTVGPVAERVPSWAVTADVPTGPEGKRIAAVTTVARPEESAGSGGIPVRGFVRGTESAPVPRAAVTLVSLAGRRLGRSIAQADGSYAVDAPGAGSYVLIASADGFQPQASTVVVDGDEPVAYDILFSGTSGLGGVVRAAETGGPVKDAMVIVTDVRGDLLATGFSGEQGSSPSPNWCRVP